MGGANSGASLNSYIQVEDLVARARGMFDSAKSAKTKNLSGIFDMLRTCRQPQIMWVVDYIEPRKDIEVINQLIREVSELAFIGNGIEFRDGYTADINQQSAFNTIRAHLESEAGNFDSALNILEQTYETLYSDLTDIRKSNLLFHLCLAFLCCGKFEQSYEFFQSHWSLLKYSSPEDRWDLGLHDNNVIVNMVYWFFVKHVSDFRDFLHVKTKSKHIWNHKKISLLYFWEYDNSWVVSHCGKPFYDHARHLFEDLPAWESKRSTPTNLDKIWHNDNFESYSSENELSGEEKYYFDQFNKEIDMSKKFAEVDLADDYLHSYYHFQTDYAKESNSKLSLFQFLAKNTSINAIDSVLEAGCGIEIPPGLAGCKYTGVSISSKISSILDEKNIHHYHKCTSLFLDETDEEFDMCFAHNFLSHLSPHRLSLFLNNCSKKCRQLVALISLKPDERIDILSKFQQVESINMHRTVLDASDWTQHLSKFFSSITDKQVGDNLYVFCK